MVKRQRPWWVGLIGSGAALVLAVLMFTLGYTRVHQVQQEGVRVAATVESTFGLPGRFGFDGGSPFVKVAYCASGPDSCREQWLAQRVPADSLKNGDRITLSVDEKNLSRISIGTGYTSDLILGTLPPLLLLFAVGGAVESARTYARSRVSNIHVTGRQAVLKRIQPWVLLYGAPLLLPVILLPSADWPPSARKLGVILAAVVVPLVLIVNAGMTRKVIVSEANITVVRAFSRHEIPRSAIARVNVYSGIAELIMEDGAGRGGAKFELPPVFRLDTDLAAALALIPVAETPCQPAKSSLRIGPIIVLGTVAIAVVSCFLV